MSHTSSGSSSDSEKAQAFAGRLLMALNEGALCLMASIGHRTGLFDAMRDQTPLTSAEIAIRAGLNERYVREWLGAMVTARVVDVDPPTLRFSLPPEHAAFLNRGAAADNIAIFTQYIALLGAVEDDIVECFRKGGGVPYEKFPRFHAVMAEDSGQSVLSSLRGAHPPARIGTRGSADPRHPHARRRMWSWTDHDSARRALRRDGVYIMQDIKGSSHVYNNLDHPLGTFLYTVSCMHCMTVSLAQGGDGMGAMWGEEKTREYLERAGFRSVVKHELLHDIQNNWYVVSK